MTSFLDLKGSKIKVDGGNIFMAGGRKRLAFGDGGIYVNGIVRFANGQEAYAILEIDESSSGEHCGTGIFISDDVYPCDMTWQGDKDFCQRLGLTKDEVFPYTYKPTGKVRCENHHVGDDGWSQ